MNEEINYNSDGTVSSFNDELNCLWKENKKLQKENEILGLVVEKLKKSNEFYADIESWIVNGSASNSTEICKKDRSSNVIDGELSISNKGNAIGGKLARSTQKEVEELLMGLE